LFLIIRTAGNTGYSAFAKSKRHHTINVVVQLKKHTTKAINN